MVARAAGWAARGEPVFFAWRWAPSAAATTIVSVVQRRKGSPAQIWAELTVKKSRRGTRRHHVLQNIKKYIIHHDFHDLLDLKVFFLKRIVLPIGAAYLVMRMVPPPRCAALLARRYAGHVAVWSPHAGRNGTRRTSARCFTMNVLH